MVCGGVLGIFGTWRVLTATKEEVELEELTDKLEQERKEQERKEAKEIAKSMLEQGMIDNHEMFSWSCDVLAGDQYDFESAELLEKLKKLGKGTERTGKVEQEAVTIEDKREEQKIWKAYLGERAMANPEKQAELDKRMLYWQRFLKGGLNSSEVYREVKEYSDEKS